MAQEAFRLWTQPAVNGAPNPARPLPPFLTSFRPEALMGAMKAVPQLPRGLLMHEWWDGWLPIAERLQTVAIVANHQIWTEQTLVAVKRAGMRALTEPSAKAVDAATKPLSRLKRLMEGEVAPALEVNIGFSDADGD